MTLNTFSIIIPIYNESENIEDLIYEIFDSIENYKIFEIMIINDGSTDNITPLINKMSKNYQNITFIDRKINKGQSYSIWEGISKSKYNTIVTIDGDGQNSPSDISKLLNEYFEDKDLSLIGGVRFKRKDTRIKIISSYVANKVRSLILKDDCIDTGCSLKVFDKIIFLNFPFFNGIHRFLPALFKGYGYKSKFINVNHRSRVNGVSKYGTVDRLFRGIFDIFKVIRIIRKVNKK